MFELFLLRYLYILYHYITTSRPNRGQIEAKSQDKNDMSQFGGGIFSLGVVEGSCGKSIAFCLDLPFR